jgi:hypothetical protein
MHPDEVVDDPNLGGWDERRRLQGTDLKGAGLGAVQEAGEDTHRLTAIP